MGKKLTIETADKHEHIFPPYINPSARSFLLSLDPPPPLYLLQPKGDSKLPFFSASHECRRGHPTFTGLMILLDVRYLVYTSIFISNLIGHFYRGYSFGPIRLQRYLYPRGLFNSPHTQHRSERISLSAQVRQSLLFSWVEIDSSRSPNHIIILLTLVVDMVTHRSTDI